MAAIGIRVSKRNMIGSSSISTFFHPLNVDFIYVVDQDDDFSILPHLDLAIHDSFYFPCIQIILNDDEMKDGAY